jgi:hypothetical protein
LQFASPFAKAAELIKTLKINPTSSFINTPFAVYLARAVPAFERLVSGKLLE